MDVAVFRICSIGSAKTCRAGRNRQQAEDCCGTLKQPAPDAETRACVAPGRPRSGARGLSPSAQVRLESVRPRSRSIGCSRGASESAGLQTNCSQSPLHQSEDRRQRYRLTTRYALPVRIAPGERQPPARRQGDFAPGRRRATLRIRGTAPIVRTASAGDIHRRKSA